MRLLLLSCSIFLILGLFELPIGYYTFLRIIITIGAVAVIITEFDHNLNVWIILFGLIAIFFNPIIPIYLHDKSAWIVPDLLSSIIFLMKSFLFHNKLKPQE